MTAKSNLTVAHSAWFIGATATPLIHPDYRPIFNLYSNKMRIRGGGFGWRCVQAAAAAGAEMSMSKGRVQFVSRLHSSAVFIIARCLLRSNELDQRLLATDYRVDYRFSSLQRL